MRYGRPTEFAIESVARLLCARLMYDLSSALEFHRRVGGKLAGIAAVLTFFIASMSFLGLAVDAKDTGSDIFGHYAVFREYHGLIVQPHEYDAPP